MPGPVNGKISLLFYTVSRFHGILLSPPKNCPDPCRQYLWAERLRNIIIGTQLKPGNDIGFLTLCRQHDNGHITGLLVASQIAGHLKAVHSWQHEVQNNEIGSGLLCNFYGLFTALGRQDGISLVFQVVFNQFNDVFFIINDQDGFFCHEFIYALQFRLR